jgi:hypothetical protein
MKQILWFVLVLAALAVWLLSSDAIWRYLFFLRLPILMGLFLLLLPKLAKDWLPVLLKNLFVLRGKWQLAFVIVSAIGAGTSVVSVASIILHNAPARFGVPAAIKISEFWQYGIAIALSLYICIVVYDLSQEKLTKKERQWGAVVGGGLTIGLLFLVSLISQWLSSNTFLKKILIDIISFVSKSETDGYINPQTGELTTEHLAATAFLLIGVAIYITVGLLFNPKSQSHRAEAPALLYLLLIISTVTTLYGGATFYFDYFRIPILLLFLLFSAFTYLMFDVNHVFQLKNLETDTGNKKGVDSHSRDFEQVLEKRLQHQIGERTLVIVCASGGGIQAAGWTVKVLTGLQELLGEPFTKAIGLISAVSGGSVGTMYYLDRFADEGYPKANELEHIFDSATQDSLDAVGWGLAYLELWRFIGLPFIIPQRFDRGTAVETDWQGEMKESRTIATWRKQIFDGEIPIPIFNATLVETGERLLITPMTFGKVPEKKFVDFNTLYGAYDMNVVTAARLSSTFPYVSPICRSNKNIQDKNYHVADGGYFDNSGFVTATEWLDKWLKHENNLNIKRVLLLQINAFPASPSDEKVQGDSGWFMETVGPLLTMFKVRDPVLASRNATEAELLIKRWKDQVEIQYFPIFFPSESEAPPESAVSKLYKNGRYRPPLSWRLTDQEKQAIKDGWEAIKEEKKFKKLNNCGTESGRCQSPQTVSQKISYLICGLTIAKRFFVVFSKSSGIL